MYNQPLNIEEIKRLYPDKAEELLKDPVHRWRAETGIELIHKEPSREEQERIWENWNEMSDEKSMKLFGKDNSIHHVEIIEEYIKKPW